MCLTPELLIGLFLMELVKLSREGVPRERLDAAVAWAATVSNEEAAEHTLELLTRLNISGRVWDPETLLQYVIKFRTIIEAFHREVSDSEPSVTRLQSTLKSLFVPQASA